MREGRRNASKRGLGRIAGFWTIFPAWLILGSAALLIPLFIFLTWQGIAMQRDLTSRLLLEKGDALIRSVEAGIRTGVGFSWGDFQIQKFLIETAQQPGIDYLVITDPRGRIVADSDPSQVGEFYQVVGGPLPSGRIVWRRVANQGGADTLEVYRYLHFPDRQQDAWIVYVGLDMGPFLAVYEQNKVRFALTALIVLLIGFAGILTLSLAQNYRAARSSLTKIKIFSDTLIDHLPLGLIGIDQEGQISFFNRVAAELLGCAAPSALGRPADRFLPASLNDILEKLRGGQGIVQLQTEEGGPNAAQRPLDILGTVWKDDDGAQQGSILLIRDMTELRSLQRQIERGRRLAAIGSLAAGVAHEIRNPLSSIKGFATYFRERYRDNPEDLANAEIMIHEVERLNRVVGQLLEFSRPLELVKRKTAIGPLIAHCLKLVEGRAGERGVHIDVAVASGTPEVFVDPDRIHQVLLNLFINALESMPQGGTLMVQVAFDAEGRIHILIRDTGAGIDEARLAHIFDPYYTTKASGTGLGLAIVHKIVEAHDGTIRIDSAAGKGTTVHVSLPALLRG